MNASDGVHQMKNQPNDQFAARGTCESTINERQSVTTWHATTVTITDASQDQQIIKQIVRNYAPSVFLPLEIGHT